jgi:hypothetical protein
MEDRSNSGERLSELRLRRCCEIDSQIMNNWRKTGSLAFTVKATDSIEGISLDELRTRYFAVGVGNRLTEIPFHDMLIVFSLLAEAVKAVQAMKTPTPPESRIVLRIHGDFPDEEALQLLTGITIETPFDRGQVMTVRREAL